MSEFSEYTIIRSRRRTISFSFDKSMRLIVRAPMRCSDGYVRMAIERCSQKIERLRQRILNRREMQGKYDVPGKPWYMGSQYPTEDTKDDFKFDGEKFCLPNEDKNRKEALARIYKKLAEAYIIPRCHELAVQTGLIPSAISIGSARTRHGSCTSNGQCRFSFRLMQYPPELIDLVIFHELTHLVVMNHSKRFHDKLESICPNARELDRQLNDFSKTHRLF